MKFSARASRLLLKVQSELQDQMARGELGLTAGEWNDAMNTYPNDRLGILKALLEEAS